MPIRIECSIEGLESNYIEYRESGWTRALARQIGDAGGAEFLGHIQERATGCHLETVDGETLTDPAQLTEDFLDRVDLRLVEFVGASILTAAAHLRTLGFVSGRLQLNGSAKTTQP